MKIEKTLAICVQLQEAEKVRKILSVNNLIRNDLKFHKDKGYIYFPLKSNPKELGLKNILKFEFEKRNKKPKSYKDLLIMSDNLKNQLPTSYDIIGKIILIKLSEGLLKYKDNIGQALLKSNRNIMTVCASYPVAGELRIRNVEIIAGGKNIRTVHKEYDLFFEVDMQKTYFSPRLANERKRITNLVKPGETIVDMFAGVAPFSIMIAKYSNPKIVFAIDKNEDAIKLAKENIKRNNVLDKVEIIHSGAEKIYTALKNRADRIIMNLPFSSIDFFTYALEISKNICVIHYYDILKEDDIRKRIDTLKEIALNQGICLSFSGVRKIKTYAPREFYIVIDITATKNADVA